MSVYYYSYGVDKSTTTLNSDNNNVISAPNNVDSHLTVGDTNLSTNGKAIKIVQTTPSDETSGLIIQTNAGDSWSLHVDDTTKNLIFSYNGTDVFHLSQT